MMPIRHCEDEVVFGGFVLVVGDVVVNVYG